METFAVRLLRDAPEIKESLEFINRIALAREGSSPPPPPQFLFGAYRDGKVVGTIGLEFGTEEKPLPLESHWEIERTKTPLPFVEEAMVEIGRWMAERPGVSTALFFAATLFALSRGKQYCLAEMKPKIAEHSTGLGFIMLPVQGAKILIDQISESGRPYYLDNPPSLYMLRVEQMHQAIRQVTPLLCAADFHFVISPG